jgi:peptide deformylase
MDIMAILPIITAPDAFLKTISKPVEKVDGALRKLMDDMLETMYDAPGIGLAAIQVGVPKRLLVIDIAEEGEPQAPQLFVNPEILWQSDEIITYNEGCLSLPEHYADLERPAEVKVRYLDRDGKAQEIHATGLLATCLQHEIDHLEGILFVDHISSVKRQMILRKLQKARRRA